MPVKKGGRPADANIGKSNYLANYYREKYNAMPKPRKNDSQQYKDTYKRYKKDYAQKIEKFGSFPKTHDPVKNRYVFFGDFISKFKREPINRQKVGSPMLVQWKNIMETMLQKLKKQENELSLAVNKLKNNKDVSKKLNLITSNSPNADLQNYIKLINYIYINNDLSVRLSEELPKILVETMKNTSERFKKEFSAALLKPASDKELQNINDKYWNSIFEISLNKFKEQNQNLASYITPELINTLKEQGQARDILEFYGKIGSKNENEIFNILSGKAKENFKVDDKRIKGISGELSLVIGQMSQILINGLTASGIKSTGTQRHTEGSRIGRQIKVDAESTYESFKIDGVQIPKMKLLISAKRAGRKSRGSKGGIENSFLIDPHLETGGANSVRQRMDYLIPKIKDRGFDVDFDTLLYNLNNEVIRTKGAKLPTTSIIVEIISYLVLDSMFDPKDVEAIEEVKNLDGNTTLFYYINGKLIPVSTIFELMLRQVDIKIQKRVDQERLGRLNLIDVNIRPNQTINILAHYIQKKVQMLKRHGGERKEGGWKKYERWDYMRDWVENTSTMDIKMYLNNLNDQLKLDL